MRVVVSFMSGMRRATRLFFLGAPRQSKLTLNLLPWYMLLANSGGLLTLTGAFPAQKGTPFMIGYGMAKAAVHQLVASLAGPDSGIPADAKVNAILP